MALWAIVVSTHVVSKPVFFTLLDESSTARLAARGPSYTATSPSPLAMQQILLRVGKDLLSQVRSPHT